MVGISSYGAYVPMYRLSRTDIAKAWETAPMGGEKAVANYDEDSITMAVAAGLECIKDIDPKTIDGLYFATVTAPYKEKQAASIIAAALDLRKDAFTADFAGSLKGGTTAMKTASDVVKGGGAKSILVCVADCRMGKASGDFEQSFGDGAAAFLVGDTGVAANIVDGYSVFSGSLEVWRSDTDTYVRTWEDRFIRDAIYLDTMKEVPSALMMRHHLTPKDFNKVVFYGAIPRQQSDAARGAGFDVKTQVQDSLFNAVGNTGTAYVPMMLAAALEEAKAGDRILAVGYGDGADALILEVTDEIGKIRERKGVKGHVALKRMLPSYMKYVRIRQLMDIERARRPEQEPVSVAALHREQERILPLYGSRCKSCGQEQFPALRICPICHSKDEMERVRFAYKKGEIFNFILDNLAASIDPPVIVTIVDFEGGARTQFDMTDCDPGEVKLGMKVEPTFRKLFTDRGIHNYAWKIKPVR